MEKGIFYTFTAFSVVVLIVLCGFCFKQEMETRGYTYKDDISDYISEYDKECLIPVTQEYDLISNELIVESDDLNYKDAEQIAEKYNADIVGRIRAIHQYQIRFKKEGESYIQDRKLQLEEEPNIDDVYYNLAYEAVKEIPDNNYALDSDWWQEAVELPEVWTSYMPSQSVNVGVIDSFLDYNHLDLGISATRTHIQESSDFPSLLELRNFYNNNMGSHICQDPVSCVFCSQKDHGTHVSGIISAKNNGIGVLGANFNANTYFTTLWQYQIKDGNQLEMYDSTLTLENAILQLVEDDCRVINMSFNSSEPSEMTDYEIDSTECLNSFLKDLENNGHDFLLIKAAGNNNMDAGNFAMNRMLINGETSRKHTIIVGAVNNNALQKNDNYTMYEMADYSNIGDSVDLVAPGSYMKSTTYGNEYEYMSGTSMAAPVVTGIASIVYSINPSCSYAEVKDILINCTENWGSKNGKNYPMVNALDAVLSNPNVNEPIIVNEEESIVESVVDEISEETIEIETEEKMEEIEEIEETEFNEKTSKNYVSKFSQIDKRMLQAIIGNSEKQVEEYFGNEYFQIYLHLYNYEISIPTHPEFTYKLHNYFFLDNPEKTDQYDYLNNRLYVNYEVTVDDTLNGELTYFISLIFSNGIYYSDGTSYFALREDEQYVTSNTNVYRDYDTLYNKCYLKNKERYNMSVIEP